MLEVVSEDVLCCGFCVLGCSDLNIVGCGEIMQC